MSLQYCELVVLRTMVVWAVVTGKGPDFFADVWNKHLIAHTNFMRVVCFVSYCASYFENDRY